MPIKMPRGAPISPVPQPTAQVAESAEQPAEPPKSDETAVPTAQADADAGPVAEEPQPRVEVAPEKSPPDPKTDDEEDDGAPLGAFIPLSVPPGKRMQIIRAELEWRGGFLNADQIAANAGVHQQRVFTWRAKYKWPRRTDLKIKANAALNKANMQAIAAEAASPDSLAAVEAKADTLVETWARAVATMQTRQRGVVDDVLREALAYFQRCLQVCAFFRAEVEQQRRGAEDTLDATSKELKLFRLAVDTIDTVFKMQYRAWGLKSDGSGAGDDDGGGAAAMPNSYEEFIAMAEQRGVRLVE